MKKRTGKARRAMLRDAGFELWRIEESEHRHEGHGIKRVLSRRWEKRRAFAKCREADMLKVIMEMGRLC